VYRPTYNSKMRSLAQPFEQINTEQLIRRFYNFVSPIDARFPSAGQLTIRQGEPLGFAVELPPVARNTLSVIWTLDGVRVGTGPSLTLESARLEAGEHLVEVVVRDETPWVRHDPHEALVERAHWNLTIGR
jgi:hypothetical protein